MCDGRRRREDAEEAADGMQNQKQEPHTKMWGKTRCFVAWADLIFFLGGSKKTVVFTRFWLPRKGPGRKNWRLGGLATWMPADIANRGNIGPT